MRRGRYLWWIAVIAIVVWALGAASARAAPQVIPAHKLSSAPVVDGDDTEWAKIPAVRIPVKGDSGKFFVNAKVGIYGKLSMNPSHSKGVQHEPLIW
ncbi:MAG: hypothetical protein V3U53_03625 [bacterium]